ncbi:MAG TPA: InlB B-repeat-containing protein, partial [Bacilli bacterium]|nr:InlB B-repeat-containing protein [Bacilli bacterium]
ADPTKVGHDFKGWYKDAGLTEAFAFPVELKADTKIYAKWEAQPRKLTFNSNGGSVVASSTVPYGTIVVKPTDPTREGYVFAGWFDEPALTTPHDFTVGLTSDMTVYAKWEADLTAYNAALAAVVEADYTPASWAAYQVVVAANVVTVDNTAEEVATATANIIAAQADLVPAP